MPWPSSSRAVYALITVIAIYGAAANALYPIALAHDFAVPKDFVKVSGGLLLLFGIGTIIGPTLGGSIMTVLGPDALFFVIALAHLLISAYAVFGAGRRARPAQLGQGGSPGYP